GQRPKVAFIFPGQGSQWLGMGRGLFESEPVFRAKVEECASAMQPHLDGWALLDQFTSEPDEQLLKRIDVVQPLLCAVQVSLAALWRSWGVEPDAVVGHSMGEVAAAHVSGALSLEDAARVICLRSRLMRKLSGRGAMAVVELSAREAEAEIDAAGAQGVEVAASNGPRTTVVSGEAEAVRQLVERWQAASVYTREVAVNVASHCRQVEEIEAELLTALEGVSGARGSVMMYSTVDSKEVSGEELSPSYWARNLRERVRFSEAVGELRQRGFEAFVEVSPHPVLTTAVEETLRSAADEGEDVEALIVGTLRKETDEREAINEAAGRLYASGVDVEWEAVNGERGKCVKLPAYPWLRQHYWANADPSMRGALGPKGLRPSSAGGHPLLGERLDAATGGRQHFWEVQLNGGRAGYLADHRVNGAVVLPGAAYVEMALAGARELFGGVAVELEEVAFQRMLVLGEDDTQRVQLVIEAIDEQNALFKFFSREEANGDEAAGENQSSSGDWSLLATGKIRLSAERSDADGEESRQALEELQQRCTREQSASNHYQLLGERALEYGPYFQAVTELRAGASEVLATLELSHELAHDLHRYRLHPVLLDAAFQTLMSALGDADEVDEDSTYLPVGIRSLRWHGPVGTALRYRSHLVRREAAEGQELEADLLLMDEEGRVKVEVKGLRARRVGDGRGGESPVARWYYQLRWEAVPEPGVVLEMAGSGRWLVLADGEGVGRQLAERLRGAGAEAVLVNSGDDYQRQSAGEYQINVKEPEHFRRLLREVAAEDERPQPLKVIHLWGLDVRGGTYATADELMSRQQHGCGSLLHLMQSLAAEEWQGRVWAVTRGAQDVRAEGQQREAEEAAGRAEVEPAQSPLWGLGRAIGHELPQQWGGLIDLDPRAAAEQCAGQIIDEVAHGAEGGAAAEQQVGYRAGQRYALRLARAAHHVRADEAQPESGQDGEGPALSPAGDRPYRLETTKPGILDNLTLIATERKPVPPGSIEMKVVASSLNFKDVLLALGTSPDPQAALGEECSGVITAVGEGVERFKVGDEVISIVPDGSFKTYVIVPEPVVAMKPPHLS
ncbi:MAG TPA: acyltransferase domain-containing protein, partial [Pyrinomonadaceae bacterium]